ncbi:hypothetical protein PoB_002200600 [Plakobranchus ocellatus]|uniref:Uncharacterized protein n=1 Tax=Plakobranchus ocellatus TaxID=259542 RepID=A0AAV3ZLW2_9GAST|nr:hypothetical protein PoB_002200600 [Plakobranchus ocellatus]
MEVYREKLLKIPQRCKKRTVPVAFLYKRQARRRSNKTAGKKQIGVTGPCPRTATALLAESKSAKPPVGPNLRPGFACGCWTRLSLIVFSHSHKYALALPALACSAARAARVLMVEVTDSIKF